ncbi:DEAD/DEAH box helicase [Sporosarcina pasteurii]|uniref:ATP-dependent RNA helicase DbpA n=1 Tax=Sporosarcina pasteurii TaxID=1474 RepID=A0A380C1S0_SPOPA|nr:DEAD/DEAH box helicase [Sporosarcina pasteurii]MDS9471565.1 DEAD/DEAH box helicase [Sporosarcina pasteurii]QBQ04820.1 DEAD/DEAH box helicase [Sporosarcina pasteurii]SUJ11121.1 ATP-dependent RNA helicase dbpA [Sporosarcina pasteurii]
MTFRDYRLSKEIRRALDQLGYTEPTEVQAKVIPTALERTDLIVKSQTGSGKTAAFAIPICEKVAWEENKPQALILTPTRELADQVKEDVTNIGRFKRIKAAAVYGKHPFRYQQEELRQKCHIVVGTPGRVLDHIERGTLVLSEIDFFVLDEADEMLNMGFIDQVEAIMKALPKERTTMLFSATLPEDIDRLCRQYMKAPESIEIASTVTLTDQIDHSVIVVKEQQKPDLLRDVTVVENPDSCIIFCRTKDRVDEVTEQLEKHHYPCDQLHGGMTQEDRFAVMDDFKSGGFRYLVATDVAARGIDIDHITHVINYDIPLENESYVHRVGRTGRAGRNGTAISFVTPREDHVLAEIEAYIGFEIERREAPTPQAVKAAMDAFTEKLEKRPQLKKSKSERVNKDILKLYFNGGKRKKLRAFDFVGTITSIPGISGEDIGIIKIQDTETYIDILNGKGQLVLDAMQEKTVKGKQLKVHKARK